ncbi:MAG: AAA family ATPase [Saprospiraceae bacterium]|nr:AAA family ATPase [Saprospiraceae bacterium]
MNQVATLYSRTRKLIVLFLLGFVVFGAAYAAMLYVQQQALDSDAQGLINYALLSSGIFTTGYFFSRPWLIASFLSQKNNSFPDFFERSIRSYRRFIAPTILLATITYIGIFSYAKWIGHTEDYNYFLSYSRHFFIACFGLFCLAHAFYYSSGDDIGNKVGVYFGALLVYAIPILYIWFLGPTYFVYTYIGVLLVMLVIQQQTSFDFVIKSTSNEDQVQASLKPFFESLSKKIRNKNIQMVLIMLAAIAGCIIFLYIKNFAWWLNILIIVGAAFLCLMFLGLSISAFSKNLAVVAHAKLMYAYPTDHDLYPRAVYIIRELIAGDFQHEQMHKDFMTELIRLLQEPYFVQPSFHAQPVPIPAAPKDNPGPTYPKLDIKKIEANPTASADPDSLVATTPPASVPSSPKHQPQPKHYDNIDHKAFDKEESIRLIYGEPIEKVAAELKMGLSVLIKCDKLIVNTLWKTIVQKAQLKYKLLEASDINQGNAGSSLILEQLRNLKNIIQSIKENEVLVIPHLDLLAGGTGAFLSGESRELTELIYRKNDGLILAFTDVSVDLPEIIESRFSLRKIINGIPKTTMVDAQEVLTVDVLVTPGQKASIDNFDPEELYRNVSGMNPIRVRQCIQYSINEYAKGKKISMQDLKESIRTFKATASNNFVVPKVDFGQIGGYEDVKRELEEAIQLIQGQMVFEEDEEETLQDLIPRGFIFYGPPGTGKTLFAKAVANRLNANIMVVSGPETMDMYVGESERKLREIFSEARRHAPSVLVFDEFDSLATKRSNRPDGGSRVGNSMVAQILTEMDGFRPDTPLLVIGTTNRLDIIDEALLRPSRFKPIHIDLPDPTARRAIVALYAEKYKIGLSNELIDVIADSTSGFNGDEIKSLFTDAKKGLKRNPPILPDAKRLGELVGMIRFQKEKQNMSGRNRMIINPAQNSVLINLTPT